jgi:2',3'-cyclic-nucleotide 2'-phosphodiesterase (5'-nucleotidase family)
VRILAIHDFHGTLHPVRAWPNGPLVGGAAALKAHMDSAAARCACPVVRLDAGDQMQGSLASNLAHGAPVVAVFNLIGIDAAAIGNHDLGWGLDTFRSRQSEARYAWLAANIFLRGSEERPEWAPPYTVIERGGVRVAVIGYATVTTPAMVRSATTAPYEFRRGYDGVRAALAAVRAYAPDFTVIVAHAAGDCAEGRCAGEMVEMAEALDPAEVHLIAGGHEHGPAVAVVNGIPIVRAGSHSRAMSVVDLVRTASGERRFELAQDTLHVDQVQPDRAVQALIEPYLLRADSAASAPVAELSEALPARASPHLGNLITDAIRAAAGTQLALSNKRGIRWSLPAGPVTYSAAHRVLPFDNEIVRTRLSGRQLRELAEHAVRGAVPDDFSGLRVRFDGSLPVGSRVIALELEDGTPVDDAAEYSLATSDYLAEGGGGYPLFEELRLERTEIPVLDAFIDHLRGLPQPVVAPGEERVTEVPRVVMP